MKGRVLMVIVLLFITNSYGQSRYVEYAENNYYIIGGAIEPITILTPSEKSITVELERYYTKTYVKVGMKYKDHVEASYMKGTLAVGLYHSFFNKNDAFYIGLRKGIVYRKKRLSGVFGAELGINVFVYKELVLGVRSVLDYRTDLKLVGVVNKFISSNYLKVGIVF